MFQKHSYHGFGKCQMAVMPFHGIDLLILQNSDGTRILSLSLSFLGTFTATGSMKLNRGHSQQPKS